MSRLRFADVRRIVPELDELRPVLDHLLETSLPDPELRWAASGELTAASARIVAPQALESAAQELARREHEHLARIYAVVARALAHLGQGDHDGAINSFLEAAAAEEGRDRPDRAEAYAAAAHRIARATESPRMTSLALRRQARATRAMGRLPEAERLYAAGHSVAQSAGDLRGAAQAAIGAGNVLEEQGRWSASEDWYRAALDLIEAGHEAGPEEWQALLNLHVVKRSRGQIDESEPWLRRAEKVAAALGDETAGPFVLNARGQLHLARGDYAAAERHLRDALLVSRDSRSTVTIRLNLAEALLAQGKTLDAAEEGREAERAALASGLVAKLPEVYRLLGRVAAERGLADAFVFFEHALEIVRDRGLPVLEEALTLFAYADTRARSDSAEEAKAMRARAQNLLDEIGIVGTRWAWVDVFADESATGREG